MKNNTCTVSYGIWGYGITGAAYARFLLSQQVRPIHVYNKTSLAHEERAWFAQQGIILHEPHALDSFLQNSAILLLSPGVAITQVHPHHTIVCEFNLFRTQWKGPLISVTGTVGKTTVTTLIGHALRLLRSAVIGGNIGIPMLDLLTQNTKVPGVLELSSFQLQYATAAADLAVITNVYPNHLDRHTSMEAYLQAKINSIRYQSSTQKALLPLGLAPHVQHIPSGKKYWFSCHPSEASTLKSSEAVYTLKDKLVLCTEQNETRIVGSLPQTPISFIDNWLITAAALDILGIAMNEVSWETLILPPHRCAFLGTWRSLSFYDDSKSTVPAATLAAVRSLGDRSIVLFLGGVSKGIDRKSLCTKLPSTIRHVICFGVEAIQLASWCHEQGIPATTYTTLEDAFATYITGHTQPNDHVLFSPGGASFDLFENYQKRGICFQKLVHEWAHSFPE